MSQRSGQPRVRKCRSPMPPQNNNTRAGAALILAAVFSFAALDTLAKHLSGRYATPQMVWFRYTFHVVALLLLALPFVRGRLFAARNWRWQLGRGLILLLCTLLSFTGLHYLPLAEFTAIGFVAPLIVTAVAARYLGEPVSRARWLAVGAGFVGVLIIIRPGSGIFGWAAALPLALAIVYALFQILTRRFAGEDDPLTTLFFSGLVGALAVSTIVPFHWATPTPADWPWLIAVGLIGAGGHGLLILAFQRADASVLAPMTYAQLVFALILGYGVMGSVPDAWSLAGMAVVAISGFASAVLQARETRARQRRHPDEADVPLSD